MLLSYGGKNCWGFKDWMEINMRVSKKVSADISLPNTRVVPAMCFEGANASGKTCALRVLSFIYDFCLNSFRYAPNSPILYDTYFNNEEKSEFFIEFAADDTPEIEYKYEAVIDKHCIYSETLTKKAGRSRKTLLKRSANKIVLNELYPIQNNIIYRNNASCISTLIQYGVEEIKPFMKFFSNVNSNVGYGFTRDEPMVDYVAQFYYEHPEIHKRVVRELQALDTGIKDVEILTAQDASGGTVYMSLFTHESEEQKKQLYFLAQSNGTKLLYNRLKDFFIALDTGGVLIFDELDAHLHSELLPYLLNYFLDTSINKKNAQLIFSSHSTAILDTLKKYRVYLFKKLAGESICYRIDEIDNNNLLRNDRSLEQMYKTGALGGVPNGK